MKKLYEDKIENEINIKLKNTTFERKKFKIEHTNYFSNLENQHDARPDIKIEPGPLGQFKELLEHSSLGQMNEPSPAQTIAGKDTSNQFMGEALPKSLLVQLTQQVAEILKNDLCKEAKSKSPRSIESPRKEDKDVTFPPKMLPNKI